MNAQPSRWWSCTCDASHWSIVQRPGSCKRPPSPASPPSRLSHLNIVTNWLHACPAAQLTQEPCPGGSSTNLRPQRFRSVRGRANRDKRLLAHGLDAGSVLPHWPSSRADMTTCGLLDFISLLPAPSSVHPNFTAYLPDSQHTVPPQQPIVLFHLDVDVFATEV